MLFRSVREYECAIVVFGGDVRSLEEAVQIRVVIRKAAINKVIGIQRTQSRIGKLDSKLIIGE